MLDKGKSFVVLYTSCPRKGGSPELNWFGEKKIKNRIRKK